MIFKSFDIENNIEKLIKFKLILIYGENIGLKETLKKKLMNIDDKAEIINLYQEDLTKNKNIISNEVKNVSLFTQSKIIFVNQADEKLLPEIESLLSCKENIKIIILGDLLDKKSKLRSLFEKETSLAIIPCYNDTDITLRKLIQKELSGFKNLNSNIINMLLGYSNSNRKTILNNIEKIKSFYEKKIINQESLEILLNSDRNEMFQNIRDAALNRDKLKLNSLLENFSFAKEDAYVYLNMINYRLIRLLEIHDLNKDYKNFEDSVNKVKPPIFWKEKPIFLKMLKIWDKQRVIEAIKYLGQIEKSIKGNSSLNNLTIVKNSITNICSNSWNYF